MEFLELKQGNMTMAKYAAKFEELMRYFPHYQGKDGESSKCVKFFNSLRPEVKQAVNYQGVRQFPLLVNMCQIWDEDSRDRASYYRSIGPMKNIKNGPQYTSGKNHTRPFLSNMVTAPTIRGLLLQGLRVIVVANPILSPLRSLVTDVVSQGTSPQIVLIKV